MSDREQAAPNHRVVVEAAVAAPAAPTRAALATKRCNQRALKPSQAGIEALIKKIPRYSSDRANMLEGR